jgi:molybdate transport system regulatory protein
MGADRSGLSVRFRIDFGAHRAVGPGKIALLEHIGASGSLSQAARDLRMSYRRAWDLLENLNHSFRERVVATSTGGRGGGGAVLTPFGRELIQSYRRFESDIQLRASRHFSQLSGAARAVQSAPEAGSASITRLNARIRPARALSAAASLTPVAGAVPKPRKQAAPPRRRAADVSS